jgi:hypothetical protein
MLKTIKERTTHLLLAESLGDVLALFIGEDDAAKVVV